MSRTSTSANKTVRSELLGHTYVTPYDTLIVAAGAGQSYFGNDHFAEWAPGMKSIDDALELRGRILGAFEQAERSSDPARREKLLTFTVVGAGPTGVEMAGQIAELADHTLKGAFRHIDSTTGAGDPARRRARGAATDGREARQQGTGTPGEDGRRDPARRDGHRRRPQRHHRQGSRRHHPPHRVARPRCGRPACRPARWAATSPTSPTPSSTARDGSRCCRTCRFPAIRTCSSSATWPPSRACPGMAQGAIQGGKYAAKAIKAELKGADPAEREPFQYFDKGSMATVSRFSAVAKVGPLEFGGFIAWLAWLVLHLVYLVGFKTQDHHAAVVDGDVPVHRARQPHHHRAAGVRANQDRGARGDRGVGAGHRESGESRAARPARSTGSRRRPTRAPCPRCRLRCRDSAIR